MNTEMELPADVIAEIQANRKVAAIKLLCEHKGINLKEAKQHVDVYIREHPSTLRSGAQESGSGFGRIIVLILGVSVIYGLYKYFA